MINQKNKNKKVFEGSCNVDLSKASNSSINCDDEYYIENGLLVFTEAYHLKRGNCCRSGCRHCPYGFRKKQ